MHESEESPVPTRIRLDKWLWAVRFFKTRALAAEAVSAGRVQVNGERVRPGRLLQIGDRLNIRRGGNTFFVAVRGVPKWRCPAVEAVKLYDTLTTRPISERPEQAARRSGVGFLGRGRRRARQAGRHSHADPEYSHESEED